jgi:hypothetical protein
MLLIPPLQFTNFSMNWGQLNKVKVLRIDGRSQSQQELGFGGSGPATASIIISVPSPSPYSTKYHSHDRRRTSITHPSRTDSRILIPGRTKSRYSRQLCYRATATTCTRAPHNRQPSSGTTADRTLFDLHRGLDLHVHPHIHAHRLKNSHHGHRSSRANWPDTSSSRSTTPIGNQARRTH